MAYLCRSRQFVFPMQQILTSSRERERERERVSSSSIWVCFCFSCERYRRRRRRRRHYSKTQSILPSSAVGCSGPRQ
jgi:hypothetical protein